MKPGPATAGGGATETGPAAVAPAPSPAGPLSWLENPNAKLRENDPEYIKRLIGQVIYVSLETVKVVKGLPELAIAETTQAAAQP